MNRTLTQKYDMGALRALQKLETDFLAELTKIYGCDEDDLPVELDLLHIYNQEESTRLAALVRVLFGYERRVLGVSNPCLSSYFPVFSQQELLKDAPGDTSALVEKLAQDMIAVSQLPSK